MYSSSTPPAQHQQTTPSTKILQKAAEWYAQLRVGDASPAIKAQWEQWLIADNEHRRAWSYVEAISQRFAPAYPKEEATLMALSYQKTDRKRLQRRYLLAGLGLFAGAGVVTTVIGIPAPVIRLVNGFTADYTTGTGQVRDLHLADGTRVWMNTATSLNVDYQNGLRRLALVDGEIHIATEKDDRPFVVDNAYGRLRALGTRFTVRKLDHQVLLAVFDGAVEITTTHGTQKTIKRGQQTVFDHHSIGDVMVANGMHEVWTRGVLLAHNMTLAEFAQEIGRYQHGHIGVAPEVADLRVFGSYPAHDPKLVWSMLEAVLPVTVTQTLPWWISINPKPDDSTPATPT